MTIHCEIYVCWKADNTEHGVCADERQDLYVREITTCVSDFAIGKTSILNVDIGGDKFHGCVDVHCFDDRGKPLVPPRILVTSNFFSIGTIDSRWRKIFVPWGAFRIS
jgi:hypothetical protein